MSSKPNDKDAPADFDELFNTSEDSVEEPDSEDSETSSESEESADALRIRLLEAELNKPAPQKTADQLRIEELENLLAERNAENISNAPEIIEQVKRGDVIHELHVVEDGFNQFGKVWLRGQNMLLTQKNYEDTKDRNGESWVDTLLNDPHAQYARWGRVFVAPGLFTPRPGEVFADEVAREDARRKGAIPTFTR